MTHLDRSLNNVEEETYTKSATYSGQLPFMELPLNFLLAQPHLLNQYSIIFVFFLFGIFFLQTNKAPQSTTSQSETEDELRFIYYIHTIYLQIAID